MRALRFAASVLRRAAANLVAQRRLHLLSTTVMALSLSLLGTFAVVARNLDRVRGELGSEQRLTAFVAAAVDGPGLQGLRERALALADVERAESLDTAQAALRFRDALGPHGAILDELGADVIPAALVVTARAGTTPEGIEDLARRLGALPGVEEVVYAQEEIRRLTALIRSVEIAALVIGGLIALVTLIVIGNTIRLTVIARASEIAIMKLVGATDSYVQLPFVLEGLLSGLGAGLGAVAIVAGLGVALRGALVPVTAGAFASFSLAALDLSLALWLVACGAALGLVGGLVAVGRFLRETP